MERDEQTAHVASCRATLEVVMQEPWTCPAKHDILWEFAIVEKVSGNCLIDACIKHENGLNHDALTRVLHAASESKASTVYNSPRRTAALTVDEIAEKPVAAGITPDTIPIVWHYGKADLQTLRDFLEREGHTGILPKNKNCISLLKPFHDNLTMALRGLKAVLLRLELLFPIFFLRHDLVGLNHRALEDALQTRLLALAFDELCKPTEERNENLRPEHLAPVAQTSTIDFYQREKDLHLDPHVSQLNT
ncbi:hypothetical protein F5B21DRAFT_522591 [Xylaria acuta]|nr:hypothetical protein F5B21DRAFT_522591 [Xylaria acuta]